MNLNGLVDDLADALGNHGLAHVYPNPRLAVAQHVHCLRRLQHHQAHGLDFDASAGDQFQILAQLHQWPSEGFAGHAAPHHQIQRPFGLADGSHAVVDAPWAQPTLGNLEASAFAQQDVLLGHPGVVEAQVHVAVGRIVVAEDGHRFDDLHAGRVLRHQDLRLLAMRWRVRVGLHHRDHDLAARIASAGDVELLAVQHPLVTIQAGLSGDLLGVGGGQIRLRHGVGGADFAVQERLQPALLLLRRTVALQHFHVAGVRGAAIQALRGDGVLAQFGGDVGVIQVLQAFAGFGVRQEEVPQAVGLGLILEAAQNVLLTRRQAPTITVLERRLEIRRRLWFHFFADELLHRRVERLHLLAHHEIVQIDFHIRQCTFRHLRHRFPQPL